jgi:hypothetical protein
MRAPALHFIILGMVLYVIGPSGWQRAPASVFSGPDRDAAVPADEAMLYRAGLALGLDADAAVVRQRLVQVGKFLDLSEGSADRTVEREARALGIADSDPVIRRHIAHLAELALQQGGAASLPSALEVEAYYRKHYAEHFLDPLRVSLTHVYFSNQVRRDAVEPAAQAALERLRIEGITPAQAASWGDPFVLGAHLYSATADDVRRAFGGELTRALDVLPERTWSDPLRSPYGLHLVWIESRVAARPRPFASVRNQIVHVLMHERGQERARARLDLLRR